MLLENLIELNILAKKSCDHLMKESDNLINDEFLKMKSEFSEFNNGKISLDHFYFQEVGI